MAKMHTRLWRFTADLSWSARVSALLLLLLLLLSLASSALSSEASSTRRQLDYFHFPAGICKNYDCRNSPYRFRMSRVSYTNSSMTICFSSYYVGCALADPKTDCCSILSKELLKVSIYTTRACYGLPFRVYLNGTAKTPDYEKFSTFAEIRMSNLNWEGSKVPNTEMCVVAPAPCNSIPAFCGHPQNDCLYAIVEPKTHKCCLSCSLQRNSLLSGIDEAVVPRTAPPPPAVSYVRSKRIPPQPPPLLPPSPTIPKAHPPPSPLPPSPPAYPPPVAKHLPSHSPPPVVMAPPAGNPPPVTTPSSTGVPTYSLPRWKLPKPPPPNSEPAGSDPVLPTPPSPKAKWQWRVQSPRPLTSLLSPAPWKTRRAPIITPEGSPSEDTAASGALPVPNELTYIPESTPNPGNMPPPPRPKRYWGGGKGGVYPPGSLEPKPLVSLLNPSPWKSRRPPPLEPNSSTESVTYPPKLRTPPPPMYPHMHESSHSPPAS